MQKNLLGKIFAVLACLITQNPTNQDSETSYKSKPILTNTLNQHLTDI